jgi:hypothetical protein
MPLHARNKEKEEGRLSEAGGVPTTYMSGASYTVHEEPITDPGASSYFLEQARR